MGKTIKGTLIYLPLTATATCESITIRYLSVTLSISARVLKYNRLLYLTDHCILLREGLTGEPLSSIKLLDSNI